MKNTFLRCEHCGNLVELINDGEGEIICCGQPMNLLVANSTEAAVEKHIPALTLEGKILSVQVGSAPHPMTPEHYIQWIVVTQGNKTQRVELSPDNKPQAEFVIDPANGPIVVYEYCNLHGLWKKDA